MIEIVATKFVFAISPQGLTGPQGIQGEIGLTGPQGIQGVSGVGSGFQLIGHFDSFVGATGTTNEIQFTGISISIPLAV